MAQKELKWVPVESSTVKEVAYDRGDKELHVRFIKKDLHYKYFPVELETHLALLAADSQGKFLDKNIKKNDSIDYLKISG